MSRITSLITDRFHRLSDTQLRVFYAVAATVSLCWIVLSAACLFTQLGPPSDESWWRADTLDGRQVLLIDSVVAGGPADRAGVKPGDRVLSINGVAIIGDNVDSIGSVAVRTAPLDSAISYVVDRQGKPVALRLQVVKRHVTGNARGYILISAVPAFSLIWLVVGTMVALARPRGVVQRRFFLTAVTIAFAFSFPGVQTNSSIGPLFPQLFWIIIAVLQVTLGAFFYSFWLRFCSSFPVDQGVFTSRFRKVLLYLPSVMTATLFIYVVLLESLLETGNADNHPAAIIPLIGLIILYALYFLYGIRLLYRGYKRMPASADRRPMKVILIGSILTCFVPLYLLVFIISSSASNSGVSEYFVYPLLLVLSLPVSFGYAIFKYQVMDFRLVIKTTLVYLATMALVVGLYLGVAYGISQLFVAVIGRELEGTVQVVVFVLCLLLFDPLKRRVQTEIENRFFPQRRDYSEHLASYSAEIDQTVTTEAVADLIARTLRTTLGLVDVCVLIKEAERARIVARSSLVEPEEIGIDTLEYIRPLLLDSHRLISLQMIEETALAAVATTFPFVIGLYAQGRTIGAVLMSRPQGEESMSSRQIQFVTSVVTQGATALEVARLYEEELARQRYQEQLAAARHIQQSLLSMALPELPGISISVASQPAQAVGGDYFKVIRLDETRMLVIVADVSGKGLPASLYMTAFHGMVCIASTTCETPRDILATINEHLYREMTRGTFITATALIFDTATETVNFARAGHTPIIRIRDGILDAVTPAGIALGIVPDANFRSSLEQVSSTYSTGDIFLLYSDGVSEAMNEQREEMGDNSVYELVRTTPNPTADRLRDRILESVEAFRGDAEQNDDITLVVAYIDAATRTVDAAESAATVRIFS